MNLIEALDILVAASESLVHPTFQEAREAVKLHRQEMENPSPIQVIVDASNPFTEEVSATANVPVQVKFIDPNGLHHTVAVQVIPTATVDG